MSPVPEDVWLDLIRSACHGPKEQLRIRATSMAGVQVFTLQAFCNALVDRFQNSTCNCNLNESECHCSASLSLYARVIAGSARMFRNTKVLIDEAHVSQMLDLFMEDEENCTREEKCHAMQVLRYLATIGNRDVRNTLFGKLGEQFLQNKSNDVRRAALILMSWFDRGSDCASEVTPMVMRCLEEEENYDVLEQALDCICEVGQKGDPEVITTVLALLDEDDDVFFRARVLAALGNVAECGHSDVMRTLVGHLGDQELRICCNAIVALGSVAPKGDETALMAIAACIEHAQQLTPDEFGSCCLEDLEYDALDAISIISVGADLRQLEDTSWSANSPTLGSLRSICYKLLADELITTRRGREVAVDTLAKISAKGSADVVSLLVKLLSDQDRSVRLAAANSLQFVADMGDKVLHKVVVDALVSCLDDESPALRKSAICSIQSIANIGDKVALDALVSCLSDKVQWVRAAAISSIQSVAKRGDHAVLSALVSHLDGMDHYSSDHVSVTKAILKVSEKGNAANINSIAGLLHSSVPETQVAALHALVSIVSEESTEVMTAVIQLIGDGSVRDRAIAFLSQVILSFDESPYDSAIVKACLQQDDWFREGCVLDLLSEVLNRSHGKYVEQVADCLQRVDTDDFRVQPYINDAWVKLVFGKMTESDGEAFFLSRLRRSNDWRVRKVAMEAFHSLPCIGHHTLVMLASYVKDTSEDPEVRRSAVETLTQNGYWSAELISALMESLGDKDWFLRRVSAHGLGILTDNRDSTVSTDGKMAVTVALLQCIEDEDSRVRKAVWKALLNIAVLPSHAQSLDNQIDDDKEDDGSSVDSGAGRQMWFICQAGSLLQLTQVRNDASDGQMMVQLEVDSDGLARVHGQRGVPRKLKELGEWAFYRLLNEAENDRADGRHLSLL